MEADKDTPVIPALFLVHILLYVTSFFIFHSNYVDENNNKNNYFSSSSKQIVNNSFSLRRIKGPECRI